MIIVIIIRIKGVIYHFNACTIRYGIRSTTQPDNKYYVVRGKSCLMD